MFSTLRRQLPGLASRSLHTGQSIFHRLSHTGARQRSFSTLNSRKGGSLWTRLSSLHRTGWRSGEAGVRRKVVVGGVGSICFFSTMIIASTHWNKYVLYVCLLSFSSPVRVLGVELTRLLSCRVCLASNRVFLSPLSPSPPPPLSPPLLPPSSPPLPSSCSLAPRRSLALHWNPDSCV